MAQTRGGSGGPETSPDPPCRTVRLQDQVLLDQGADRGPGRVLAARVGLRGYETERVGSDSGGRREAGRHAESSHHSEGLVTKRLSFRLQLQLEHVGSAVRDLRRTTRIRTKTQIRSRQPGSEARPGRGRGRRTCDCLYRASRTA